MRPLCLALLVFASALPAAPSPLLKPPRVALVLSGGGPRSLAHAGVLRALDELRVPVELIVGTSGGALVGGFAATGLSGEEINRILQSDFDFFGLFADRPQRSQAPMRVKERDFNYVGYGSLGLGREGFRMRTGLSTGRRVRLRLRRALQGAIGEERFDALPIPFRAAATDLVKAEPHLFDHGDLADAMMASLAVPTVFAPVRAGGTLYADGLLFDNLPIQAALDLGARHVVVVDLTTPIGEKRSYESVANVAVRLLDISVGDNMRKQLAALRPDDLLLRPDVSDIGNLDYARSGEAFERGRQAALAAAEKLKPWALSPEDYARWKAARRPPLKAQAWTLAELNVEPPALRTLALDRLGLAVGKELDLARLEAACDDLAAEGRFEDIDYHVRPLEGKPGQARVDLELREQPWAPNPLGLGFKLVSDLQGFNEFEVLLEWSRTGLNAWNGELRQRVFLGRVHGLESEWYQPLGATPFYFAPGLQLQQRQDFLLADASADLGVLLGRSLDLRVGALGGRLWSPPPSDNNLSGGVDLAAYRAQASVDSLDDPHFPSQGTYFRGVLGAACKDLNSPPAFRWGAATVYQALHVGPHVLLLGGDLYSHLDTFSPAFQVPRQGGFLHLSGYPNGRFTGQEALSGKAIYYYRQRRPLAPFGETLVYGVAFEAGQVYPGSIRQDAGDGRCSLAVLAGASSYLGPIYLAHARNFEGSGMSYFFLGNPF